MEREDTLDPDTVGNLAHGKARTITAAADLDDETFEGLDTFLFTLDYADLQTNGITTRNSGRSVRNARSSIF